MFAETKVISFAFELRRLTTVSSNFELLNFDGSVLQMFINCCYNNDIKQIPNHC